MQCPLNYGAVLQTYALQTYLENNGYSVKVIDYQPDFIVYDQKLSYIPEQYKTNTIKKIAYLLYKAPHKYYRKHIFRKFLEKHINLTEKYKTYEELCDKVPEADKYICGSDQIWGYGNDAYKDPSYFLAFVKNGEKCISYAPSGLIPNPLPNEMQQQCVPLIERLGYISVREKSSQAILQKYISKKIHHVLDPVFLLDRYDWKKLFNKKPYIEEEYILLYTVGDETTALSAAEHLSKSTGKPIYQISSSQRRNKIVKKTFCPTPNIFLNCFYNASHIVTNSFHGTSFSIIFEKSFTVCGTSIANERLKSLLESCGLSQLNNPNIGFNTFEVNDLNRGLLNHEIQKSKDFLTISI